MSYPFAPQLPADSFQLTALDCGRGEAIFLVLPDRATALVGAGGLSGAARAASTQWDPGENIVSPYLWSLGIKSLDVLVAPRIGGGLDGVLSILRNFRVRELWWPRALDGRTPVSPQYVEILVLARRRDVRVREVAAGETLAVGITAFNILAPLPQTSLASKIEEDSLALRVSAGHSSALIAGTLSTRTELQILESSAEVPSQVLTTARPVLGPQHSPFLEKVSPRIIIRTAGPPEASTLAGTQDLPGIGAMGARILWTDRDGAVTTEMKATSLWVRTFLGGLYIIP